MLKRTLLAGLLFCSVASQAADSTPEWMKNISQILNNYTVSGMGKATNLWNNQTSTTRHTVFGLGCVGLGGALTVGTMKFGSIMNFFKRLWQTKKSDVLPTVKTEITPKEDAQRQAIAFDGYEQEMPKFPDLDGHANFLIKLSENESEQGIMLKIDSLADAINTERRRVAPFSDQINDLDGYTDKYQNSKVTVPGRYAYGFQSFRQAFAYLSAITYELCDASGAMRELVENRNKQLTEVEKTNSNLVEQIKISKDNLERLSDNTASVIEDLETFQTTEKPTMRRTRSFDILNRKNFTTFGAKNTARIGIAAITNGNDQ